MDLTWLYIKTEKCNSFPIQERLNWESLRSGLQEKTIKHIEYVWEKDLLFQLKSKIRLNAFDIESFKIMTVATTEREKQTEDWLLGRLVMSSTDQKNWGLISFLSLYSEFG